MANRLEKSLADSAKYLADRMTFWAENKPALNPIVEHIENGIGECDVSVASMDVNLRGGMSTLIGVVSYLEELGYAMSQPLPEETVSYWTSRANAEGKPALWIYWSNTVCRRVQVGTKMEEVPIYEVRCGEEPTND